LRLLRFHRHPVSEEYLSVYLDGRLPARDKERVDAHLQSCADCSRKLEEMQSLVAEMRRLPQATAPRSFAISPELAAAARREAGRARQDERTGARRVYLGLSGATVAAAVLLVAVVGVDLFASRGGGQGQATGIVATSRQAAGSAATDQAAEGMAGGNENLAPGVAPPLPSAASDDSKALLGDAAEPTPAYAAPSPSGGGATKAQQAQPDNEETQHVWLWVVEGAAGGLVIGFGASAFWMRRRWVQINRS